MNFLSRKPLTGPRAAWIIASVTVSMTVISGVLIHFTDKKNYPLIIKVHARERVKVDAGEFDCLVVEPILRGPGIFTQKGRLMVWLTDDERRMPVLMKSKVAIGHVAAVLKSYKVAKK